MATPALNPLVEKIRTAHPGAYDDMDDAALTKAVLNKYPQYSDLAAPSASSAPGAPPERAAPGNAPIRMQPSYTAAALGSPTSGRSAIANPQQPAEQFALENPDEQGTLAAASMIGAAGAAAPFVSPIIAPVAKAGLKIVKSHPILTMAALEAAKHLPGPLGTIAGHVPSWLPLLAGGKEAAESGEFDATGENKPFAGGEDEYSPPAPKPEPDLTGLNKPYAGGIDGYTAKEVQQAGGLRTGAQVPEEPAGALGKIPLRAPGTPTGQEEILEDRDITQKMREDMDRQRKQVSREYAERNSPAKPKGQLIEDFKTNVNSIPADEWEHGQGIQTQIENTPTRQATGSQVLPEPSDATDDLTPLLKKSLRKVQAQKKAN